MKDNLEQQVEVNKTLISRQSILRTKYDDSIKINHDSQQRQRELITEIEALHSSIFAISPTKQLTSIDQIGRPPIPPNIKLTTAGASSSSPVVAAATPTLSSTPPPQMITSRTMSVPTAAALKQGVGFPLNSLRKDDTGRILSTQCVNNDELLNECGICKKCNDQHLLAKCDTCHLYYHLGCLNPPLTRHPKRSKLYAWQCSECDKSDDSAPENIIIPKGQRRSRNIRYSKDGIIHSDTSVAAAAYLNDSFGSEESFHQPKMLNGSDINLTDYELEAHVKETLQAESSTAGTSLETSSVSATVSAPPVLMQKKKRERKRMNSTTSKKMRKNPPAASTSVENHRDEIKMEMTTPFQEQQQQQVEKVVEHAKTIELKPSKLQSTPPPIISLASDSSVTSDNQQSTNQSSSAEDKKPKRGRPPKKTISQISNDLQKQIMPVAIESPPLLDLSKKIECPLDQYRAFADIPNSCIPYPVPTELPNFIDESESIPKAPFLNADLNGLNGDQIKLTNGDISMEYHSTSGSSVHHKHKKRKSHKRRHSNSPSPNDGDRQSSSVKKHKRKHKHKDHEAPEIPLDSRPTDDQGVEQPRIKIKFRAILQAGDDKKPPKFLWHVPHEGSEMNNGGSSAAGYSTMVAAGNNQVNF